MGSFKMNKNHVVLRGLLVLLLIGSLGAWDDIDKAEAQNFANLVPEEKEEELSPLNVEEILENEGVPLLPQADLNSESSSKYTLGIEDVIQVSVLRHPEVSGQYVINGEGNIQYEFIGDVQVIGLTKDEIAKLLVEKLSNYIISPEVTVKIAGYNSKVVYVIGEVGRPGKIYMRGNTITIREALVQAGLPLLSAKGGKTLLITPSSDGHPQQKNVNVDKLLYKGDLRENLVMSPGDTLYVPPTLMAKALRVIQPVAAPVGTASGLGRTVTTGF